MLHVASTPSPSPPVPSLSFLGFPPFPVSSFLPPFVPPPLPLPPCPSYPSFHYSFLPSFLFIYLSHTYYHSLLFSCPRHPFFLSIYPSPVLSYISLAPCFLSALNSFPLLASLFIIFFRHSPTHSQPPFLFSSFSPPCLSPHFAISPRYFSRPSFPFLLSTSHHLSLFLQTILPSAIHPFHAYPLTLILHPSIPLPLPNILSPFLLCIPSFFLTSLLPPLHPRVQGMQRPFRCSRVVYWRCG